MGTIMSELPDDYPDATGKGDLHIPGAGTFGMALLLVSLTMLFLASIAAFLIIRVRSAHWPPPGFPPIPNSLWFSTAVILCASVTIQMAVNAIRRDDEMRLRRYLWATFYVGIAFLLLQTFNWIEFYMELRGLRIEGAYMGMFYVLTGLHAAHVLGGLIPLGVVIAKARRGAYSRNFYPGVRYSALYWHFLDIVWLVLFSFLYF